MPDQQDEKPKPCCRGLFRFHRSTLVIALLMLLPWLLVALPGRKNGGGGTTGFWTTRYLHGLPFVFLERQSVEYSGTWANKIFTPGVKPKDVDFGEEASKCMDSEYFQGRYLDFAGFRINMPERDAYEFNEFENASIEDLGFWSNANRWPWIGTADGEAIQIRWAGLLADLSLVLVVFWLFACAVEGRLKKRGKHLAFSLAESLVALCVVGVFSAWVTTEYRRAAKENEAVDRLMAAVTTANGFIGGRRHNSLPAFVSELFDHRSCVPFVETHLFRSVEEVSVSIYDLDDVPTGTAEALVDAIENAGFPIELEVDINEQTLPMFQTGKSLPAVKQLGLRFEFDLEWDDQTDSYVDDIILDFKLNLPEIRELSVELQTEIDQEKQLTILDSMRSLERLEITELNQKGAACLSSTTKNFPSLKELDLSFCFEYYRDNETDTFRDYIDPNFKLNLPEADETRIAIWLQTETDQKNQLETFSLLQHLARITINDLNQEGAAYLASAAKEFPSAKQLEISFDFSSDLDNPILANRYDIDLDFKLPFPRTEEVKINLNPKYDQEKQLRMFAPFNRFKRLRIHGLTRAGATYLNSIANELPPDTGIEFKSDAETIELLPPAKQTSERKATMTCQ